MSSDLVYAGEPTISFPIPLIPVVDLLGGQVVRGIAGKRAEYRPWSEGRIASGDPEYVVTRLLEMTGSRWLYVADLDAIEGRGYHQDLWSTWPARFGVTVIVDVGLKHPEDILTFPEIPELVPIAGTETLAGPLAAVWLKSRRCVVSVDSRDGIPLADPTWGATDIPDLAVEAQRFTGAEAVILLDLAHVGTTPTVPSERIRKTRQRLPADVPLWLAGGIRTQVQLDEAHEAGASAVLVSSALHLGTLGI
ncbi:MAG: HisA/HisF-related TIM barrel protein [Fimbriiglobus sp.]